MLIPKKTKHIAVCILTVGDKYLLLPHKNGWDLCGGVIGEYDSPDHAAQREVYQNTGLEIDTFFLGKIDFDTLDTLIVYHVFHDDITSTYTGSLSCAFSDEELNEITISPIVKDLIYMQQLREIRKTKKIAMVHGVFDLCHYEHVKLFDLAKQNADYVIVSLVADRFVDKGPNRPLISEENRAYMLSSLRNVNKVIITKSYYPFDMIRCYKPDVWVHGGRDDEVSPENELLKQLNIPIVVREDGLTRRTISTTSIIGKKK